MSRPTRCASLYLEVFEAEGTGGALAVRKPILSCDGIETQAPSLVAQEGLYYGRALTHTLLYTLPRQERSKRSWCPRGQTTGSESHDPTSALSICMSSQHIQRDKGDRSKC